MATPVTPYLSAWKKRGDWTTRDALHAAAGWEQSGLDRIRPMADALAMADKVIRAAELCQSDLLANFECDHEGEACLRRQERMVRL